MHANLEVNLATKEGALEKLAPAGKKVPRFKASGQLFAFLASL